MEQLVLRDIPTADTEEAVFKSLRLPPDTDPEDLGTRAPLVRDAAAVARPKAVRASADYRARRRFLWSVDGVRFDCALMAEKLPCAPSCFPLCLHLRMRAGGVVADACGPAPCVLGRLRQAFYVGAAQTFLFSTVRERYLPTGHLAHEPALSQWPLPQQRALFPSSAMWRARSALRSPKVFNGAGKINLRHPVRKRDLL